MKSYALGTILLVVLVLAGCSRFTGQETTDVSVATEEKLGVAEETVVEETLNVESVEESFSPGTQEDDYGDII